jgi:hypothetical protein
MNLIRGWVNDPELELELGFDTQGELDAAIPNGNFTFNFGTASSLSDPNSELEVTATLLLPTSGPLSNLYPDAPQLTNSISIVTNGTATNIIDPTAPHTMQWANTWSNAKKASSQGGHSFIFIDLEEETFGDGFFGSDDVGDIADTDTQFTIPAGELRPGRVYEGLIEFINGTSIDEGSQIAGALGQAGYITSTEFQVFTSITFEQWLEENNIDLATQFGGDINAAANANLDNDAYTLAQEYLMLDDPHNDNYSVWRQLWDRGRFYGNFQDLPPSGLSMEFDRAAQTITLRFTRWTEGVAPDTNYAIFSGNDIQALSANPTAATETVLEDYGTFRYVEVTITLSGSVSDKEFHQFKMQLVNGS